MFVVVGVVGVLLLIAFLLLGDVLEGVLPESDWLTGDVIGAFLAAFGLFGWVTQAQFDTGSGVAALVGVGGGVGVGWIAYRLTRALGRMRTEPSVGQRDLVGKSGRVVTAVAPASVGEVIVNVAGQSLKLSAVADRALARGTPIVVVEAQSPTRVSVQSAAEFWGPDGELEATP